VCAIYMRCTLYIIWCQLLRALRHEMQMQPISLAARYFAREKISADKDAAECVRATRKLIKMRRTPQIPARKPLENTTQLLSRRNNRHTLEPNGMGCLSFAQILEACGGLFMSPMINLRRVLNFLGRGKRICCS
jgi:hypothetical protein